MLVMASGELLTSGEASEEQDPLNKELESAGGDTRFFRIYSIPAKNQLRHVKSFTIRTIAFSGISSSSHRFKSTGQNLQDTTALP
jgi:hypothetical protein